MDKHTRVACRKAKRVENKQLVKKGFEVPLFTGHPITAAAIVLILVLFFPI